MYLIKNLLKDVPKKWIDASNRLPIDFTYDIFNSLKPERNIQFDFEVYLPLYDKPLQRPFCWSIEKQRSLIISILLRNPIGLIWIIKKTFENKQVIFKVIDGKQRISTIISFIKNEFPIVLENQSIYYKDISEEFNSSLFIIGHYLFEYEDDIFTDEQLINMFYQINFAGEPHNQNWISQFKLP